MSTTLVSISNDELRQLSQTQVISAAATLTAADSGKHFSLNAAAGAQITLPAVATSAGLNFRFTVQALFATTAWTIKAATNVIQGGVIVNSVNVPGADENTITFSASADTIGDFVQLNCDGVNWYVSGVGTSEGAITLTVV
jgi:hypothetical protein